MLTSCGTIPSLVSVRFLALSLYQNHNWQSRKCKACLCSKRKENLGKICADKYICIYYKKVETLRLYLLLF